MFIKKTGQYGSLNFKCVISLKVHQMKAIQNANRFSNDRKQQFMNKNAPHNHAKSNEKYEQRKNVNVNSMQNKQIRNAKMTPVKQSPRSYTPRKLFAHNESMRNTTGSPKSFFF